MAIIVYFDQSILSNLVKHRQGRIKDVKESDLYKQLAEEIQRCINRGCHVFPESSNHLWEAQLDSRIDDAEWRYLKDVSYGLEFTEYSQMLDMQINRALDQWLQDSKPQCAPWENVFNRDPNEPYVSDPFGIYARFPFSTEFVERQRSEKKDITTRLTQIVPVASKRTAAEQAELELRDLILSLFAPGGLRYPAPSSDNEELGELLGRGDARNRLKYLARRGLSMQEISSFLQSQELAQVPILDIRSKLWGYLMVNAASRPLRGSDPVDIEIMAMTLPYCHIVTTDSYMKKAVVEDLKLAESYHTLVLSAKLKDVEELTALLAN